MFQEDVSVYSFYRLPRLRRRRPQRSCSRCMDWRIQSIWGGGRLRYKEGTGAMAFMRIASRSSGNGVGDENDGFIVHGTEASAHPIRSRDSD